MNFTFGTSKNGHGNLRFFERVATMIRSTFLQFMWRISEK
jgi:hypothetical protein